MFYLLLYCDKFINIPAAAILIARDVPPKDMIGRGRPFAGNTPVATDKLIIA
jgi:hypothetical protein